MELPTFLPRSTFAIWCSGNRGKNWMIYDTEIESYARACELVTEDKAMEEKRGNVDEYIYCISEQISMSINRGLV